MTQPLGFLTTCPRCGGQLQVHVGDGQSAPWLCTGCCRGWWCAELSTTARRRFRPLQRDFGHGPLPGLVSEVKAALDRKHSVPDEMLGLPGVQGRLDVLLAMKGRA